VGALVIAAMATTALIPASGRALTWSIKPSPSVSPAKDDNVLDAVSCVSATSCMATGFYYGRSKHGQLETALTEAWNGTTWSAVPSPSPVGSALYGVSCVSARACVAVGASFVGQVQLAEFWNGTRWSVMPNNGNVLGSELLGVSCVSATDCIAVGDRAALGRYQTFIQSWNGTRWSTVPSPNPGSADNFLSGVSCISATACTAAGQFTFGSFHAAPLIESWNGTRWSAVPAPNKTESGYLNGISCASADACVAVGTYLGHVSAENKTLIESWNGSHWSIEPVTGRQSRLSGVSCVSASICKAAGNDWNKSFNAQTFVESWNGTAWSIEPTPNNGSAAASINSLNAVSCASASFCAAVGNHGPANGHLASYTLAEIGTTAG
jgi:hypothetical protein